MGRAGESVAAGKRWCWSRRDRRQQARLLRDQLAKALAEERGKLLPRSLARSLLLSQKQLRERKPPLDTV